MGTKTKPNGLCRSNSCKNGKCLLTPAGDDFHCVCADGWEGDRCDERKNTPQRQEGVCNSINCKNGGECFLSPAGDDFHCVCADGWEGDRCELSKYPARTRRIVQFQEL